MNDPAVSGQLLRGGRSPREGGNSSRRAASLWVGVNIYVQCVFEESIVSK